MFRRLSDDVICERLGKRPLEVAADCSARAAHAAFAASGRAPTISGVDIPLVWSSSWHGGLGAIEVYPAATRIALGVPQGRGSLLGTGQPRVSTKPETLAARVRRQEARLETDLRETQTALLRAAGGSANNVVAGEGSTSHSLHL